MKSTTRWTREAVLALGNVIVSDNEGEGGTQQQTGTEGQDGGTGQTNSTEEGNSGGSGSDDDGDDPEVLKRKLRNKTEEQDRQFRKLKEAERERDELRTKQEEADRKNKSELENTKSDLEKAQKTVQTLTETVQRLTIENAFGKLNGITWHDVNDALRFVDLSDVEFDSETGKVKDQKAIVEAAKKLAKDKPYLVKTETTTAPPPRSTGRAPAGRAATGKSEEELRKKYQIRR